MIKYAHLNPSEIFNLCDPAYLPEITREWQGLYPWWSPRYDAVRELMRLTYVREFDEANGHYQNLLDSIQAEGIRNPVCVNVGFLLVRAVEELPPHHRDPIPAVCEYVGGSRLMIAQRLGLMVPCIVNDPYNCTEGEVLRNAGDIVRKFADAPRTCVIDRSRAYVNHLPYTHMHDGYTLAEQSQVRARVVDAVRAAVTDWLAEHD